jgi:hypothetical protein
MDARVMPSPQAALDVQRQGVKVNAENVNVY